MFCIRGLIDCVCCRSAATRACGGCRNSFFVSRPRKRILRGKHDWVMENAEKLCPVNDYTQVSDCMSVVGWEASGSVIEDGTRIGYGWWTDLPENPRMWRAISTPRRNFNSRTTFH